MAYLFRYLVLTGMILTSSKGSKEERSLKEKTFTVLAFGADGSVKVAVCRLSAGISEILQESSFPAASYAAASTLTFSLSALRVSRLTVI